MMSNFYYKEETETSDAESNHVPALLLHKLAGNPVPATLGHGFE
jgi:hypothetical protein